MPHTNVGNNVYELSISNPTTPTGIIKVLNQQNCWDTETISTILLSPTQLNYTSVNFVNYGVISVNESVKFTNGLTSSNIPSEYDYIVWDFGDNTFETQKDTVTNAADTMGHVYPNAGTYSVKMTLYYQLFNGKSCSVSYPDTSLGQAPMLVTIEKCSGTSIASNALSNNVKLYPNPALNKVNIDCKEKTDILIYDSRGVLVDEITCEGLKTFDLKYLGTGLYFFISKENQLLGKLIVE